MARVLLGWELGGGYGHVAHLLPLARELAAAGHEILLALRDPVATWPLLRDSGFPVVQAPLNQIRPDRVLGRRYVARTWADLLYTNGYHDAGVGAALVGAWRRLVESFRPDLVVAEYAPGLCLAAHGIVPALNIGTGFTVPCLQGAEFPVLNGRAEPAVPQAQVASILAEVLARIGAPVPASPFEAVLGDEPLVITFDCIDPFAALRTTPALGPLWVLPPPMPMPRQPSCLVYLPGEHVGLPRLLAGLRGLRIPGTVYVRDAGPRVPQWLQGVPLAVSTRPVDLDVALPETAVVLHHGGAGITQRCLAAGRPQVVAPLFLEQALTTSALVHLGVARGVDAAAPDGPTSGAVMAQVLTDRRTIPAAQALSAHLRTRYPGSGLDTLVARCIARLQ